MVKYHKANFSYKPTCTLITPSKANIGKISKQIVKTSAQI